MNELVRSTQSTDYTITDNGEAYISQRKLVDISGVPKTTLQNWITSDRFAGKLNLSENNQLHHSSIGVLLKYAVMSTTVNYPEAESALDKVIEAGSKAYVYHLAGIPLQAVQVPMTRIELATEQLRILVELDKAEKEVIELRVTLDKEAQWSSIKKQEIRLGEKFKWQPLKKFSLENEYEVKRAFDQNYGHVNSYHEDVWLAVHNIVIGDNE